MSGLAAIFQASACSRPPQPRRRMFMHVPDRRNDPIGRGVACSKALAREPRGLRAALDPCYDLPPTTHLERCGGNASMDIKPLGSMPSRRTPADYFTGTVWQDPIIEAPAPARIPGAWVRFELERRTAWR